MGSSMTDAATQPAREATRPRPIASGLGYATPMSDLLIRYPHLRTRLAAMGGNGDPGDRTLAQAADAMGITPDNLLVWLAQALASHEQGSACGGDCNACDAATGRCETSEHAPARPVRNAEAPR